MRMGGGGVSIPRKGSNKQKRGAHKGPAHKRNSVLLGINFFTNYIKAEGRQFTLDPSMQTILLAAFWMLFPESSQQPRSSQEDSIL